MTQIRAPSLKLSIVQIGPETTELRVKKRKKGSGGALRGGRGVPRGPVADPQLGRPPRRVRRPPVRTVSVYPVRNLERAGAFFSPNPNDPKFERILCLFLSLCHFFLLPCRFGANLQAAAVAAGAAHGLWAARARALP